MSDISAKGASVPGATAGSRKNPYVYFITALAALGGLLFGYDTGVISGALLYINQDFHPSAFLAGLIVSAISIGSLVGALTSGALSDVVGRKKMVIVASIVFGIGALATAFSPDTVFLIITRFVLGYAVGCASVTIPPYIAEVAPTQVRGLLVSLYQLAITIGILCAYLINFAFSGSGNWHIMLGLAVIPALILFIGMLFVPESPRWFIGRNRVETARLVLQRVRGTADVEDEIREIQTMERQEQGGFRDLFSPWVRPMLIVGLLLGFFGPAAGINAIIYFAPTLFTSIGLGNAASLLTTVGVGVINVLMTVIGMLIIDKVGRRSLLIFGLAWVVLSLIVLSLVFMVPGLASSLPILPVICVLVYIAAFAISVDMVVFLIPAEIFPLKIRGVAMSSSMVVNQVTNFVVSLTFLTLLQSLGQAGTFWIYTVISVLFLGFTIAMIPETRGRSLEEIQASLHHRSSRA
ncbi:sugar porter family MFS transporter [Ktedonosporobacter rubrisoli]|uniref:Sugar porter family MFS transporter n=1 Tax=Ktedonosporobacter rubrisoli TaxID=2509675 RepID=A0A4P6JR47_KTERU|nr:sugar porter family MFS transporter [Ktedonosporobacter rubrisoli]QBD77825.1 sugar porter family MFS transporter [Ktedonosporobacter rubrisoli]